MRLLLLGLFFCSQISLALEPREFVENYARLSNFERSTAVYDLCTQILDTAPTVAYINRIRQLGQLWATHPDASYAALSTCHSMWMAKFLDPVRAAKLTRKDRSMMAYFISGADLLYTHLPEEIRLYMQILPSDRSVPLSPYEVLTDMASSQRQMEETLHREMRAAANAVLAVGGGLAMTLKSSKTFTAFVQGASESAGRVAKQALLISALAWGAGELADYGLWQVRRATLESQAAQITARLKQPGSEPLSILLDEYYRVQERLGYFYNFDLYLAENGHKHNGRSLSKDAASIWTLAAQFLSAQFPQNREATAVADRLVAKAKRAVWRQLEAEAHLKTLPICRATTPGIIGPGIYECNDPQTGAWEL